MEQNLFPRTEVAGISMPRMIVGTNWMAGCSHRSTPADQMIQAHHATPKAVADVVEVFLNNGVDAMMGLIYQYPVIADGIKMAEDRTGKKMMIVDTPGFCMDDTKEGRKEAEETIKACKKQDGATFCLVHHGAAEQLVNKNKRTMDRLPDYLKMIRDYDMIPGLSAHMPELVQYSDENEYDVETYIQIYNCMGFLMQVEIELVNKIIWSAKKPVMTIKPMAAGRCTPFVGLNFNYATLRDCDMVTVGCLTAGEAAEDIEISRAAIDRRKANIKARGSVIKTELMRD